MVTIMGPHVEGVQDAGVTGVAGAEGADADIDEPDMPPPQALSVAAKAQAAADTHRRGLAHARIARCEHCIEISSLC
ncbi:MAG TPA: hypothetical protein VN815_16130 [Steroidobacteraceae bacterium]|jgi:hypothetical protein|nr:hypothetical protein [Steroidobacteraceae bacterium]